MTVFTPVDWCIIAVYLIIILAAGWYCRKYVRSMTEFIVAGRSLGPSLAAATLIGSELGLVTLMYSAQKGFNGGFSVFHIALSAGVITLIVGLTGFIVVPLRRLGVMTIPEFYEYRFGPRVRIFGGLLLAVSGILNMGMFLKAGAIFVTGLTGMTSTFELNLVMTLMLAMVLAYTMMGGMLSIVVTDYLQFLVLSVGLLVACGLAVSTLGWGHIADTVQQVKGAAGIDPFHPDGGGATYVAYMAFIGLGSAALWQTSVIRACSAVSVKAVKRLYVLSSIGFLIRFLIPYFLGIAAFVYFTDHASTYAAFLDPDAGSETTLRAMPVFLAHILPTGLLGLTAAAMLAAFMSTHDSYILCWSAVLTQDVVAPLMGNRLTKQGRLVLTRIFIFAIGVFLLIWSLWYPLGQDLWNYMAVTGTIYFAGAFSLLAFGIYWRRASAAGAVGALLTGFLAVLGLAPVQRLLDINLGVGVVGLGVVGLAALVMVAVSLLWPDKPQSEKQVTA